jgi:hypothetical protein
MRKSWRIQGILYWAAAALSVGLAAAQAWALEVVELDDGHARAGRWVEGGGVEHLDGAGVGDGFVDQLVELGAVDDFHEGRAFGVGGDHPDGGGVLDADALAEGVVGFDFGGQLALRVDGEGQGDALALANLVVKSQQDFVWLVIWG